MIVDPLPLATPHNAGATLLLLHGFTGSGASWAAHAAYLRTAGLRVLSPDLPGHGANLPANPDDYTMEVAAGQLAALLEAEKSGPVHLLGYSMGGRLALYFALHYPEKVRSLILESASPGLASAEERAARRASDDALADRIEREGIPAFVAFWESLPLWKSQACLPVAAQQWLHESRLRNDPTGLARSLAGMGSGVQPSLWERLNELRMPALLLAGAEDAKFVEIAQQMAERIPSARLEVVPEAGHTVHWEQPDAFREIVVGWVLPARDRYLRSNERRENPTMPVSCGGYIASSVLGSSGRDIQTEPSPLRRKNPTYGSL
ncbi:MAG: 2-succinyl-6-hydroxy-2,4-cyclohexadiene-1-carboxylate synthase [Chloroflexi bacterium]|nr:MAG: 2-succinyl-6-hydroxy-2,4-cyclohexadiene-1-carboxylate synthase [Chloroflexota bacterium]